MVPFSKKQKPFLSRIFHKDVAPIISEGWIYGAEEAAIYGGYTTHHAIDFAVPLGTPVLAAADGFALGSFEEVRIRYPGHEARTWQGEPIFWGYGLFIAILHDNGFLTFYAHLHRLREQIWQRAFVPPEAYAKGDVVSPITRLSVQDFRKTYATIRVKAGEPIGFSGITGMGIGQSTYENWRAGMPYRANDEEHVHFAVCKSPGMTATTEYIDPFAIHGYAAAYPVSIDNWAALPNSLWIA